MSKAITVTMANGNKIKATFLHIDYSIILGDKIVCRAIFSDCGLVSGQVFTVAPSQVA